MADQTTQTNQADQTESTQDLPDGYEVMVGDDQEDQTATQVQSAEEMGENLTALRNLIARYADQLDQAKDVLKELRQSQKNLLENDLELSELEQKANTINTDVRAKKKAIQQSPESVQIQMKIKEQREEQNEIQETLNNYLLQYYQLTGSKVIEDDNGAEREIKINAKISRPKAA